jgi:hypothetical protein
MEKALKSTARKLKDADDAPRRKGGLRALNDLTARISGPALRRYGFAQDQLIAKWPEIAGPILSDVSLPIKLSFPPSKKLGGTLTVQVEGPYALQIQHIQDLLIARVNQFFGYRAVERLRLQQGDVPRSATRSTTLTGPTVEVPPEVLALPDGPLKDSLVKLAATFPVDIPKS